MKVCTDCVPCLLRRVLFQSRLVGDGNEFGSMQAALRVYADNFEAGRNSVSIATEVHRASYRSIGTDDPYRQIKIDADRVASRFVEASEEMVGASDDPVRAAMAVAVAGNIMDFGSGNAIDDPELFDSVFWDLVGQGFAVDDIGRAEEVIDASDRIVYMFDNCGESELDKVLIRLLRGRGKELVGVVRGAPILNDVSYGDAVRSGLADELDLLLTTGKFYIGVDWSDLPDELSEAIAGCGIVIAKGMANYEALCDEDVPVPVLHLLRAKCEPIARSIGVETGSNVALLRGRSGRRASEASGRRW